MSSNGETVSSPPSSPILQRGSPARGTVARRCREFYLRRLERTTNMQKRWSMCEPLQVSLEDSGDAEPGDDPLESKTNGHGSGKDTNENTPTSDETEKGFPLRKCRSSLDLAMDSLRKEISSLIAQDNDLFKQLLSLHDSIAELRERQRSCYSLYDDDEDEENVEDGDGHPEEERDDSPSLESLSDNGDLPETSPDSTLSCRSSLSSDSVNSSGRSHLHHHNFHHHNHHHHRRHLVALPSNNRNRPSVGKKRHRASNAVNKDLNEPRPLIFVDKSAEICFRCQKVAPPYRRSRSITNFYYYLSEDMDSYDSGIHLQGSHSDSDHEIFV